jgi:ribosomal protein S18 acetylase RimI-like enzyme
MSIQITLATPADDGAIRGLLRREPVPGRIAISYEREPSFAIGCDATGENAAVLVARDVETGDTIGVACRSEREVYVNAAPVRLGYLGQLRIDRRFRGRWLVSRGYGLLKRLHDRDPLPGYLAALTADNREAEGVLVRRSRKWFPAFHPIADFRTLALYTRRSACAAAVRSAVPGDVPRIVRFLRAEGPRRQFFPVWNEAKFDALTGRLGLRVEDIQIYLRNGTIAGVMALWDHSAYKQNVVRGYSGWMRLAAALRLRRLPRPGETIRSGYAAFLCISEDHPQVFRHLLSAVLDRAAARGLDYLLLGLDARDPLLPAAQTHSHVPYRSRLFLAEWPDGGHLHAQLDCRPTYVEIATL